MFIYGQKNSLKIPSLGVDFSDVVADAAFNTTTQARNHVEVRTGLFNAYHPIAKLIGNAGMGPHLDLGLFYSPVTNNEMSIGDGWSLPFSVYNAASNILFLSSGETVLFRHDATEMAKPGYTLSWSYDTLRVKHKNGKIEYLARNHDDSSILLTSTIMAPNGSSCSFTWDESLVLDARGIPITLFIPGGGLFTLTTQKLVAIENDDGTELLHASYDKNQVIFKAWPNSPEEQTFTLLIDDQYLLTDVISPTGETQHYGYIDVPTCGSILSSVQSTAGLNEQVEYEQTGIAFLGEDKTSELPSVRRHSLTLSAGQPAIVTEYTYAADPDGIYTTTRVQGNNTEVYTYDVYRALKRQETVEEAHRIIQSYDYSAPSDENPPQQSSTTYSRPAVQWDYSASQRTENILNYFDNHGNLIKNVQGNITTEWEYYSPQETEFIGPFDLVFSCAESPENHPKIERATHTDANGEIRTLYIRYIGYSKIQGTPYSHATLMLPEKIFTYLGTRNALQVNTYHSGDRHAGRIKFQKISMLDENGGEIALSQKHMDFEYRVTGTELTTIKRHLDWQGRDVEIETRETVSTLSGRLIAQVDAQGNTARFEYDAASRLAKHTLCADDPHYATAATYEYSSSLAGRRVVITEKGVRKAVTTDEANQPISEEIFTEIGYDAYRQVAPDNFPGYEFSPVELQYLNQFAGQDQGQGKRWFTTSSTQYDERGRTLRQHQYDVLPDGTVIHEYEDYLYDPWGQRRAVIPNFDRPDYRDRDLGANKIIEWDTTPHSIRPAGQEITLDDSGRIQTIEDFTDVRQNGDFLTTFEYVDSNDPSAATSVEKPYRVTTDDLRTQERLEYQFVYDVFDRVVRETVTGAAVNTPDNRYTLYYEYPEHLTDDKASRICCGYINEDGYDTVQYLGSRAFDRFGRVIELVRGDHVERFSYEGPNTSPSTRFMAGTAVTTRLGYISQLNNALASTDTNGVGATFNYVFNGAGTSTSRYQDTTRVLVSNALEQTVSETRTTANETSHTRNYSYSLMGRVATEDNGFGLTISHVYDHRGAQVASHSSDLAVSREFDNEGNLLSERIADAVTGKTYAWSRDFSRGKEDARRFEDGHNATARFGYLRDGLGRINRVYLLRNQVTAAEKTYEYNSNGSLKKAVYTGEFAFGRTTASSFTYRFDTMGNLTSVETADANHTYTYETWAGVQVTNADGQAVAYHQAGPIQSRGPYSYGLNVENRKIADIAGPPGKLSSFAYGPDGNLVQVSTAKPSFTQRLNLVYRHGAIASQYVSSPDRQSYAKVVDLRNTSPGLVVQRTIEGNSVSTLVLFLDIDGSVLYTFDVKTRKAHLHLYTPYGLQPDLDANPVTREVILGFKGEHVLAGSQLYPLGNGYRLYDPETMQFTSLDDWSPFGAGGLNACAFCDGDPINRADPSGHASFASALFAGLWRGFKTAISAIGKAVSTVWNYTIGWPLNKLNEKFPLATEIFWGVVGVALAAFTGGGSMFLTAAMVGAAIVSAGLGIASVDLAGSDPHLSKILGWASLGAGVVCSLASLAKQTRALGTQLGKSTQSVVQNIASRTSMAAAKSSRAAIGHIRGTAAMAESLANKSMLWLDRSATNAASGVMEKAMKQFRYDVLEELVFFGSGVLALTDVGDQGEQAAADRFHDFNELPLQPREIQRLGKGFLYGRRPKPRYRFRYHL